MLNSTLARHPFVFGAAQNMHIAVRPIVLRFAHLAIVAEARVHSFEALGQWPGMNTGGPYTIVRTAHRFDQHFLQFAASLLPLVLSSKTRAACRLGRVTSPHAALAEVMVSYQAVITFSHQTASKPRRSISLRMTDRQCMTRGLARFTGIFPSPRRNRSIFRRCRSSIW